MTLCDKYANEADEPLEVSASEPSGETIRTESRSESGIDESESGDSFIVSDSADLEEKTW